MNDWWQRYNRYLESDHWARLRKARLRLDHYRCTRCGGNYNLTVHHLSYRGGDFYDCTTSDVRTLCLWCHEKVHGRSIGWGQPRRRQEPMPAQGCQTLAWVFFWICILLVVFGALLHSVNIH
jgi:hypothetical protein